MLFWCLSIDCSEEEYECETDFACIPQSNRCDGIPNCYMGDDEMYCGEGEIVYLLNDKYLFSCNHKHVR